MAANILSYQTDRSDWPKNLDTTATLHRRPRSSSRAPSTTARPTDELRFLARIFQATQDERYRQAFDNGLGHILQAQYPNGGWPQSYAAGQGLSRYITFNDNAMVRLMEFLREVYGDDRYRFVAAERRQDARAAFDRGVQCILRCQIKVDGKLTAWCAQHDEKDFSPRPARTFELASLSGSESVGIVQLLMSLEKPTPEVVQAVDAAVAWFQSAALKGIRQEMRRDSKSPKGFDKVVVKDANAPPLWARFYEIGTNRPIFSDRDGVAKRRAFGDRLRTPQWLRLAGDMAAEAA